MVCIYCGGKTEVFNSRLQKRQNRVWRRRRCLDCQAVFTSLEAADLATGLVYLGSHNQTVPFQRDVLFVSLYEAGRHRPDPTNDAKALTDTLLAQLVAEADAGQITRSQVVHAAHDMLNRFDYVAGVTYQAFHPL